MGKRPLNYALDAHGKPVPMDDLNEWIRWYGEHDHTVAFDVVNGVKVATIFLGIDQGGFPLDGPPVLWETAVLDDQGGWKVARNYTSQEDALAGHAGAVGAVLAAQEGLRFQPATHDRAPDHEALRAALQAWSGAVARA